MAYDERFGRKQCKSVDNKTTISTKIFLPHLGKLELAYDERVWEADNKAEPDRADHILLCMHFLKMQSMFFAVAQNALKARTMLAFLRNTQI